MRLAYINAQSSTDSGYESEVIERITTRRSPHGLLALDLTLLSSPAVADRWNTFFAAVQTQTTLPVIFREIVICRVALINEAWYQWEGHTPLLRSCQNFDEGKMETVKMAKPCAQGPLSDQEWAVLRYADAVTREVAVDDGTFEGLKVVGFSNRDIVELTVIIAAYNCVSRVLVALDVGEKNAAEKRNI
ncbi:uncharacterized protein LY89DRAFT_765636 [Mollisia scopiformis]|uniref:Carboxymuconolactone decarboxylase-like domain-containing protein n=1 Tax=Mollisia scopiformis TaxID=149040 RepID=A0A132B5L0_MOLSC|nr:uncharacterized protein LY89DRAFT_765636 [Mollisia scopiformis]KUJ07698.1 hypothetical protein LY89DRAFT_765636 [Mollisia scopiformis]